MSIIVKAVLCLSLLVLCGCVKTHWDTSPEVHRFVQLLINADEPTLSEYEKFSGEGDPSEIELIFELRECNSRGWEGSSNHCIRFIQRRWSSTDQQKAFFLNWLRKSFSTVGKSYRLIGIESKAEGFNHDLVEVEIGENKFLLFHNTDPNKPTGVVVNVSRVNGKRITDYLSP